MKPDRQNLLICKAFVGRVTSSSGTRYKLVTDKITDILASRGIQGLPGKYYDSADLAGTDWKLENLEKNEISIPQSRNFFENNDKTMNVRFSNYEKDNSNIDLDDISEELEKI